MWNSESEYSAARCGMMCGVTALTRPKCDEYRLLDAAALCCCTLCVRVEKVPELGTRMSRMFVTRWKEDGCGDGGGVFVDGIILQLCARVKKNASAT